MSLAFGSSTEASIWVARKTRFDPSSANSRARTEEGRPMTNGIIMWGKTTTSRMGIIGSRSTFLADGSCVIKVFRLDRFVAGLAEPATIPITLRKPLARLLQKGEDDFLVFDHLVRDEEFLYLLLGRELVHNVQHKILEDDLQSSRAHFPLQREAGDGRDRIIGELELDVFELEQLLV